MFRLLFSLLICFGKLPAFAQSSESKSYPETLWSPNDTFSVRFSNMADVLLPLQISERDTTDYGTDGGIGVYTTIYYGRDSLIIPYTNLPYSQYYHINIRSPKGKTVYQLHFNPVSVAYTEDYVRKNTNKVAFDVPEVYELANIIWTLSPSGRMASNLNKQGEYFEQVVKYFKPYQRHPLLAKLDFSGKNYFDKYYDFRENSFAFDFANADKLVWGHPYFYVEGKKNYKNLFKELVPLIEDFAKRSKYRSFYKAHLSYYQQLSKREMELMPVRLMWKWLENEFPDRYNSVKVVFSPLIGATHSTQSFSGTVDGRSFLQIVMFVAGPNKIDVERKLSQKQKQGMASGIVFTELDHNYVNRVTSRYKRLIDSVFSVRSIWTSVGGDTQFYDTPESVFNEYMTHAVFCLYMLDNFDAATAEFVIKQREALMVEHRHYIKFREFNRQLIHLRNENKQLKVSGLYPMLLDWCKTQM